MSLRSERGSGLLPVVVLTAGLSVLILGLIKLGEFFSRSSATSQRSHLSRAESSVLVNSLAQSRTCSQALYHQPFDPAGGGAAVSLAVPGTSPVQWLAQVGMTTADWKLRYRTLNLTPQTGVVMQIPILTSAGVLSSHLANLEVEYDLLGSYYGSPIVRAPAIPVRVIADGAKRVVGCVDAATQACLAAGGTVQLYSPVGPVYQQCTGVP